MQPDYHYNQLTKALCCHPSSPPLYLHMVCIHSVKHAYHASTGMQHLSCRLSHMCKEFSCGLVWQKGTKGLGRQSTGHNLFGHDIFRGCTFSLWPFMLFMTSHKKMPPPPPPDPDPPSGAKMRSIRAPHSFLVHCPEEE